MANIIKSLRSKKKDRIKVSGKTMQVLDFLKLRSKDLPPITDKVTGKKVDHIKNLRRLYMDQGASGVNGYVNRVRAVYDRDQGATRFIRLRGWMAVAWFRIFD